MLIADQTAKPSLAGPATKKATPRPRAHKALTFLLLALTALGAVWAINHWRGPGVKYLTARLDRADMDSTVTTTGNLNAVTTVQVGSQVSGNITALYADFNTRVKKGQLLALIDPAPFQAALDQAKGALGAARAAARRPRPRSPNRNPTWRAPSPTSPVRRRTW
jgi:HlyD family secretion protein